jgi:DNA gyrase subunit A
VGSTFVASFPVEHSDQIMLVTDRGQLIRIPVDDIRIAGRSTQGVTLFDVADGETVASVGHLTEEEAAASGENGEENGEGNGNGGEESGPESGGESE